ncbi:MAG: hypothetical protein LBV79_03605, partial [Candidatus Adiutrix sp.]|nr:hypothetical protein [Candidatus Adiutrix sp.]
MKIFPKLFPKARAALLLLVALWAWAAAPLAAQVDDGRLRDGYQRLKQQFEEQVSDTAEPRTVSVLSVESSALAWRLSAAGLNPDPDEGQKRL